MQTGSVVVVGTGINTALDLTAAAHKWIENAQEVFYLVGDGVSEQRILQLHPQAQSLKSCYEGSTLRSDVYQKMVETVMQSVRAGHRVCAVFYGHPGVFVFPSHAIIRRARREGHAAMLLPGISAMDWLFADLGIDPGESGCQCFEATDFLIRSRRFDTASALILWQIGAIGNLNVVKRSEANPYLPVLIEALLPHYSPEHTVVVYEAATNTLEKARIKRVALAGLMDVELSALSTLYVPPKEKAPLDQAMVARLGLPFA